MVQRYLNFHCRENIANYYQINRQAASLTIMEAHNTKTKTTNLIINGVGIEGGCVVVNENMFYT